MTQLSHPCHLTHTVVGFSLSEATPNYSTLDTATITTTADDSHGPYHQARYVRLKRLHSLLQFRTACKCIPARRRGKDVASKFPHRHDAGTKYSEEKQVTAGTAKTLSTAFVLSRNSSSSLLGHALIASTRNSTNRTPNSRPTKTNILCVQALAPPPGLMLPPRQS